MNKRVSKYNQSMPEKAHRYGLLGLTEEEIAKLLGVSRRALKNWKRDKPEFKEALTSGKQDADSRVAKSLFDAAISGDTTACIFWLKNRARAQGWNDAQQIQISVDEGLAEQILAAQLRAKPKTELPAKDIHVIEEPSNES